MERKTVETLECQRCERPTRHIVTRSEVAVVKAQCLMCGHVEKES